MSSMQTCYWKSVLGTLFVWGMLTQEANFVLADIVPDTTLPTKSKVDTQNNTTTITGGTKAGNNLFHSFQEFSVRSGNTAFFNNSRSIENIISRVTGNSISNIDGLIKANGRANLFLINPSGIVFGENAQLNIGGSFLATSANSIKFSDGSEFSAKNPDTKSLLTISAPIGLQYGNAGDIKLQGSNLQVDSSKSLALVGGNLRIDGGELIAESGRIELGGLTGSGTVTLDTSDNSWSLNYPVGVERGDLFIRGAKVLSDGGGSIWVNARNVDISEVGVLRVGFQEGLGGVDAIAGDVNINATDDITLKGGSVIASFIFPNAVGNAGDINVQAGSLNLLSGSQLFSSTAGEGNSGNINVNVGNSIVFDSADNTGTTSGIINSVADGGVGNAGNVLITTGSLSITNGAQLNLSTNGKGNTGNLTINASDTVIASGSNVDVSSIFTSVGEQGIGRAGEITVTTRSLNLLNGSQLFSRTAGQGNSGNINVNSSDRVVFDSADNSESASGIITSVDTTGVGNAGDITLTTSELNLLNGSQLFSSTAGRGNSGNINVDSSDRVVFDSASNGENASGIITSVDTTGVGNAGDITLTTGSLNLLNGSQLFSSTAGRGNSGNINVDSSDRVVFDSAGNIDRASGIISSIDITGVGDGGDVTINAGSVDINNGAQLNVFTNNEGDPGDVTINARNTVSIDGSNVTPDGNVAASGILTSVGENGRGQGGDISITTGSLSLTNGAQLNALSKNQGSAGNVTINARDRILLSGENQNNAAASGIFTTIDETGEGSGGDISIFTGSLDITKGAGLYALTNGKGSAGDIFIEAKNNILIDGVNSAGGVSGLYTSVTSKGVGNAGEIKISTGSLVITSGAELNTLTEGQGSGGSVYINARNTISFDGVNENGGASGILTTVDENAVGNAGDINIETESLSVTGGAGLFALTQGKGSPGNIDINARKQIVLDGSNSGIFNTVEKNAVGDGEEIQIKTGELLITNGAILSSTSLSNGAAGNITVDANSIGLNHGTLSSDTVQEEGNINLRATDLILRNDSNIRTDATGENVIGGNINIDTGVLAGFENSDITANSKDSRGGNVRISTEGVFGIEFRDIASPLTSDITATGANNELSGNVEITTPDVDPTDGLIELPDNLVDASNQISNACTPGSREFQNTFVSTGRGGLPISPTEPLQENNTLSAWVRLKPQGQTRANRKIDRKTNSSPRTVSNTDNITRKNQTRKNQIVEANGWIVDGNGNITLVAQANQTNLRSHWQANASCSVSN